MELIDKKELCRHIADWQLGSYTEVGKEREYAVLDEVIDCIVKMPAVMRWIPVTERLPDEGDYLCAFDDGFICTVSFIDGDWELWADATKITHWMELPKFETEVEE